MSVNADRPVETIPWSSAVKMLETDYKLKTVCGNLIHAANARFKTMTKDEAKIYRAKYSFTEEVIRGTEGFSLPQGSAETVQKLGLTQGVPVCLVLRNMFEVYLPSTSEVVDAVQSRRVLLAGDLFGVFEAANRLCKIDNEKNSWRVMAGARTARLLYPFSSTDLLKRLLKTVGHRSDRLKLAIEKAIATKQKRSGPKVYLEDWTWDLMVTVWRLGLEAESVLSDAANETDSDDRPTVVAPRPAENPWNAEIFIFPPQWFDTPVAAALRCEVLKAAWQQSRDDLRRELQRQALSESDARLPYLANIEGTKLSHVHQLLLCLDDAANRRAVAYRACMDLTSDLVRRAGPFEKFIPTLHKQLTKLTRNKLKPALLVPTYLAPGENGFVSFYRQSSDGADLEAARVTDLLSSVGAALKKSHDDLMVLLPSVEWKKVCFYAGFQDEEDHYKNISSLSELIGNDVHCTNRFFQHCAHLISRGAKGA